MKKFVLFLLYTLCVINLKAQLQLPVYSDADFSTYYHQRWTHFKTLPTTSDEIIFIGNSITDGGEWAEIFDDLKIKNRGISGDISAGIIHRIGEVVNRKPRKIFMLIGVNDLSKGISPDSLLKNILSLTNWVNQEIPSTKIYVQSILPVNESFQMFSTHTSKQQQILQVNQRLAELSRKNHFEYIDLFSHFSNENGKLHPSFSNDGLHLNGDGYMLWKHLIFPYVYDHNAKASLIPFPKTIKWNKGFFPLYKCKLITISNDSLHNEAITLQEHLDGIGIKVSTGTINSENNIRIDLKIVSDKYHGSQESYTLNASPEKIVISAGSRVGVFHGIQTLKQLMRDHVMIDAVTISDEPAFSWRGYMVDVGRNYNSLPMLKQQIDALADYKYNVFHFHATEDVAWRFASKQYPQLTSPETMTRNKGMYYTEGELKEILAYCKKNHIEFVPEIDMPGHSAAFKRAMGVDMQSDSGLHILKNILTEFANTYEFNYFHLGGDEVKITNKNFIPEITKHLESLGKKTIGWQPGGNFLAGTIRQLWMEDPSHSSYEKQTAFIDSRHLYLNHMDPLETVTTLFNRKILNKENGDDRYLGATLCMWHDRAVSNEKDILETNAVYPGIIAFAERAWKGEGHEGWIANINEGDTAAFRNFETRLIDHKNQFFYNHSFPYYQQSQLSWILMGPFNNEGDVHKKFPPELQQDQANSNQQKVTGATIILRHWWSTLIKGALVNPKENTTWYATTKIWSDEPVEKKFWIDFQNISRSHAADSPVKGTWDNKGSAIWVNEKLITPPDWKRAGQKGNLEIPLTDEGYSYREPTKIFLKKGWNTILIKCPVSTFQGKDWQHPVKWMFTFLPID